MPRSVRRAVNVARRLRLRRAGDEIADRRLDAAALQGGNHDVALPAVIGDRVEMLDGAAAARAEMAAGRLDAQRRRVAHRKQRAAVAIDRRGRPPRPAARTARTPDRARSRQRRRPARPAARWSVACSPVLRSRQAGIRDCRRRRRSATGKGRARASPASRRARRAIPRRCAGRSSGSRSRPPLPIAARPASNCGLTSRIALAPGAASSSAGGSASLSEMKLTSQTMKSGARAADDRCVEVARVEPFDQA